MKNLQDLRLRLAENAPQWVDWSAIPRTLAPLNLFRRGTADEALANDPASAMFAATRRRLTLSYAAVLGVLLILSGILLYVGLEVALLGTVDNSLQQAARAVVQAESPHWQDDLIDDWRGGVCDPRSAGLTLTGTSVTVPYVSCYSAAGTFMSGNGSTSPWFDDNALVLNALQSSNGTATDTIQGTSYRIRRYAQVIYVPNDPTTVMGVIQVGIPVGDLDRALNTALVLMIVVGVLTLVGSLIGGVFLSERALAPTRQAFARQQTFIADASHELRTPLTLMRADAELLLSGKDKLQADDVEMLQDIVSEAEHMSGLVTNLLTLARLDTGSTQLHRDVVELPGIAEEVVRRAQAFAAEKQVTLRLEPRELALVLGDQTALEQAAMILVDNAIKYNRPGGEVQVSVLARDGQALLCVRDTGIGIPAEALPHLGERFYRVEKSRNRAAGGSGLGLAIARSVAHAHGGDLHIESTPNVGTTVTLQLSRLTSAPGQE